MSNLLKTVDEKAEEIAQATKLNDTQAKVAMGMKEDKQPSEIAEDYSINQKTVGSAKRALNTKMEKAENFIEAAKNGFDDREEALENSFLTDRMADFIEADKNQTYLFKNNVQERLKENPDLEINNVHDMAEKLDEETEDVSRLKSWIKNELERAENTVEIGNQLQI